MDWATQAPLNISSFVTVTQDPETLIGFQVYNFCMIFFQRFVVYSPWKFLFWAYKVLPDHSEMTLLSVYLPLKEMYTLEIKDKEYQTLKINVIVNTFHFTLTWEKSIESIFPPNMVVARLPPKLWEKLCFYIYKLHFRKINK